MSDSKSSSKVSEQQSKVMKPKLLQHYRAKCNIKYPVVMKSGLDQELLKKAKTYMYTSSDCIYLAETERKKEKYKEKEVNFYIFNVKCTFFKKKIFND